MDCRWLQIPQSAERCFAREVILRRLRAMDPDKLLEVAEKLAENLLAYEQLVRQAAERIDQLEQRSAAAVVSPSDPCRQTVDDPLW